jgi:large exoprotein involved in heme utilization and adhesion
VISRVTGGEVSNIDGTLASTVGQADLYFLNPAGVMFGPNAQLDVPGSFHVSTAHELRFADGARFSALDKTGSGLTVAPPEAFGFLDKAPVRITVDQSQLQLKPGKTFSLVGGDLDLVDGAHLAAASGTINLAAAASAGQVRVLDSTVDAARQGAIRVADQALIDVSGNGGGTIRIRGGTLEVQNSSVYADNTGERDSTTGLDLQAGSIEIANSAVTADVLGSGQGGAARVNAGHLVIRNGGYVRGSTFAIGNAGQVTVDADRLLVSGSNAEGLPSMITSSAYRGSSGAAGTVAVTARELELYDRGQITSTTIASGNAGHVIINARYLLASGGAIGSSARRGSSGQSGVVTVTADRLELQDAGQITSSTFASGNAGQVTVNADRVVVSGIRTDAEISDATRCHEHG